MKCSAHNTTPQFKMELIVAVTVLAALLLPVWPHSKPIARRSVCVSQLRQQFIVRLREFDDNQARFPGPRELDSALPGRCSRLMLDGLVEFAREARTPQKLNLHPKGSRNISVYPRTMAVEESLRVEGNKSNLL